MTQQRKCSHFTVIGAATTVLICLLAVPSVTAARKPPIKTLPCTAWQDDFTTNQIDPNRWVIANGRAPGYIANLHIGYYQPDHVSVESGIVKMLLTQEIGTVDTNTAGVISRGALIYTKQKCGYGTYSWRMRMSSTAATPFDFGGPTSGSVSAGFNYVNNSETEIDFEFSGKDPDTLWLVNWLNTNPASDPAGWMETYTAVWPFDSTSGFHTYTFVWKPGIISYYIDGYWKADHTTDVPSAYAYFMINHWGTDGPYWGGTATIGISRYSYIDRVSYTPPQ